MRRLLTALAVVIAIGRPALAGQQASELVLDQPPFHVVSAFWPNLHHFLWAEAWARRPPTEENAAGPMPEPRTAPLEEHERRVWDAAVRYYDEEVADLHPLFEMRSIRKAMIAAGSVLPPDGLEAAHHQTLIAAAPVYRKHWWPAHDAANRAWVADPMAKVAALSPAVPERLALLYGNAWLTGTVRLDVVRVANREGAFTSIDPAPAHITISSSAPAMRDWTAAEILFHEASHAMAIPLMGDFAAELRTQRKASRDLWHVALFFLTGEVVREALERRGVSYEPYLYSTSLFDRAWPHYRAAIEDEWKPFIQGQVPRREAIRNVVRATQGLEMSLTSYLTDIVLGWRLADVGAILLLTIWTSFRSARAGPGATALVIGAVAAALSVWVTVFVPPGANAAVHGLAAAGAAGFGSLFAMRMRGRSWALRAPVLLVACAVGYGIGRGLAGLLFSGPL